MRKAMAAIDSAVATISDFALGANPAHDGAHAHGQGSLDQHVVARAKSRSQDVDDLLQAVWLQHLLGPQSRPTRLISGGLGSGTVRDEQVEYRRRADPDPLVAGPLFAAQFEHVAQDGDLAPAG